MPANPFNTPPPYEGGCACGAVRYRIEAETIGSRVCHCRICQKAMASPFLAVASFPKKAVTVTGETARWRSSERLWRHFCPKCGSSVTLEPLDGDRLGFPLATLDDPQSINPEMHIWVSAKVPWLMLSDGLPQYPEGSPEPYRTA
ncbi:glutathione-dependent formaldehyde-activating GFA [Parvibaculum lavamentivorans DS-1]|uniref:Glutathione-dependent formaldehyde-activating GFA n=1 Tax=Parvibaculum lavamentivorans (strain DS-1 / DSM 13023 / NCIMB 13966) TaxID=402881 RepID=A7HXN1_PARL1|nr:GFA family protein [Parvibaculum lavamentivorans]ABS64664.1 glutathione-dependent formaldehyde-activating GFA [Parvibaculum lavamentivorans DS-1]